MSIDAWIVAGCAISGVLGQLFIAERHMGARLLQLDNNTTDIKEMQPLVFRHTTDIEVLKTRCDERRDVC